MIIPKDPTGEQDQKKNSFDVLVIKNNEVLIDIRKFKYFHIFKQRFLKKFPKNYQLKENENCCWEWLGFKEYDGYGRIKFGGDKYSPHRMSYLIFNGLIPQNKIIRHTCDNKFCVNPNHLILGSYYDNMKDYIDRNGSCLKLNEEAIKVIKWFLKYKPERGLAKKLANLYGVDASYITHIKKGHNWNWVEV